MWTLLKNASFFRIRELEAENSRLKDKLAVDEIKLNLVMSCETQFVSPTMSKTLSDLKGKLSEKDVQIGQLRKRLRIEEHRSHNANAQRDQVTSQQRLGSFGCVKIIEIVVSLELACRYIFMRYFLSTG